MGSPRCIRKNRMGMMKAQIQVFVELSNNLAGLDYRRLRPGCRRFLPTGQCGFSGREFFLQMKGCVSVGAGRAGAQKRGGRQVLDAIKRGYPHLLMLDAWQEGYPDRGQWQGNPSSGWGLSSAPAPV